ncbi:MAG: hypothetical protein R2688_00880 [Fimbriimonadaceae bacterium]
MPTYTATGHFHGKVSGDLQDRLAESRKFALGEYWLAMAQGSNLPEKERAKIRKKLSQLTGLTERYLDQCDLRPVIHDFTKELLRDERRSVGRLDSRFRG